MVKDILSFKRLYDPVHGFIRFDDLEKILIDSIPFQRLHYIHQLGIAYLVYPGATHTRFEHSLGVMELASKIYNRICKNVTPDLFHFIPQKGSLEYLYWHKVLRIAALCHDLGHLPFSHVAEGDLVGEDGHEKWTVKIIESNYLKNIWDLMNEKAYLQHDITQRNFVEDIIKVALGEEKLKKIFPERKFSAFSSWEKILSKIISCDFFGADRIDYLLRDAKCTGIVYGLFDYLQLIEMIRVLPSCKKPDELELGIDENGVESCEALLLARHFMHKRVYQYSSIRAYNFHLRRFMNLCYADGEIFKTVERFIETSDNAVILDLNKAVKDKKSLGHDDASRILNRQRRFKAIDISPNITENNLMAFKKREKIPDDKIFWEFCKSQNCHKNDLSFPVARRNLIIREARDCSSLLSSIPTDSCNWVYISPEYEIIFLQFCKTS